MQFKRGEALALYDNDLLSWCRDYTDKLRHIELSKFDEISAHIFEYIDVHTKMTKEEIEQQMENKRGNNRGDNQRKHTIHMVEQTDNLLFGIWANV
jgi:hypothetical protein